MVKNISSYLELLLDIECSKDEEGSVEITSVKMGNTELIQDLSPQEIDVLYDDCVDYFQEIPDGD